MPPRGNSTARAASGSTPAPTQRCQTCHQATNTADGFVPGVSAWGLAPLSMLWEGKTKARI
jgi:hypothetical protein